MSEEYEKQCKIIEIERKSCVDMNMSLLTECKTNKRLLDSNYGDLYMYIAYIQTSVIFFSTASAFMQALSSQVIIPMNVQFSVSLIISTYISLVLSLSKFFKLDERKENVHNLREKFAELHNKIRFRLDTLKPWSENGYIHEHNIHERMEGWQNEKGNIFNDYYKVIENKETLFMEFEKLLDSNMRNRYTLRIKEEEDNHSRVLNQYEKKKEKRVAAENTDQNSVQEPV